jgi:PPOX class probable F420-dependent enzyme
MYRDRSFALPAHDVHLGRAERNPEIRMSIQTASFAPLLKENYVSLTTFHKNGIAVATPVGFVQSHGTIYVRTGAATGKVKRIRNSGRVMLAPCTAGGKVVGPQVEGKASLVSDQEEIARAVAAFASKYGMQFRLIAFFQDITRFLRRRTDDAVYLAILP